MHIDLPKQEDSVVIMEARLTNDPTGCPKKMALLSSFEFLGLGGVFLGVKNTSKNFGNKKKYMI